MILNPCLNFNLLLKSSTTFVVAVAVRARQMALGKQTKSSGIFK